MSSTLKPYMVRRFLLDLSSEDMLILRAMILRAMRYTSTQEEIDRFAKLRKLVERADE